MAQFPEKVIQTAKRKAMALEHVGGSTSDGNAADNNGGTSGDRSVLCRQEKEKIMKTLDRFDNLNILKLTSVEIKENLNNIVFSCN